MARGDSQTGGAPVALSSKGAAPMAVPSIPLGHPSPSALEKDGGEPAVAAFRRSSAENDNGSTFDRRNETRSFVETGRFHDLTTPFGFALLLSLAWVAAVLFANVFISSLAVQLLSAGGPIAIFCAMQYWRSANESMKNRIRSLEQERADANKANRMAQLEAKARADLATLDKAVEKTIDRSLALSDTVDSEVQRLEGVCRESEGLLAGLIQSAVEAELRAVSSHKQLQEAAAAEAKKLQAFTGDVSASFEASGAHVIGEVTASLDSAREKVEALFDRKTADVHRSFDARVKQLTESLSARESEYQSRLDALNHKAGQRYEATARAALDSFDRATEAFSTQLGRQNATVAALVEKRTEDIQGSLSAHAKAMDDVASTMRRDIESSQKLILAAFSDFAPSLSGAGAKLLDGVSESVANNKAQTDEAIGAFLVAIDGFEKERRSQIEAAMQEITGKMASSYGQIAVLFDVQGADFVNRLDGRIEALRAELDERKRVIEEFLTTSRASLSEEALKRLEAFDLNIQNQAMTLHSAMSVRLMEIDAMVSRIGDRILYELGASIDKLKDELPRQAETFAREIADAGSLVNGRADAMAQTLEQSSSVFLEVLEKKTNQLDKTIVEDGSALLARVQETADRLAEVMSETKQALDANFRRDSADAIAAMTSQNEQIEAMFNKAVQSAIDQMGSHIDFLVETLANSATRLDHLIRIDGGQLAAGLNDYAERAATDIQTSIDRIDALYQGRAEDWAARVNESSNVLVREIEAKLGQFDGHVEQKLHDVFESTARLIVRLQNGLDLKAGILNEMLGRRASELSKIIGTMIDGYASGDGPKE